MSKFELDEFARLGVELDETYRNNTVLTNELELAKEGLRKTVEKAEAAKWGEDRVPGGDEPRAAPAVMPSAAMGTVSSSRNSTCNSSTRAAWV